MYYMFLLFNIYLALGNILTVSFKNYFIQVRQYFVSQISKFLFDTYM